MKSKLWIEIAVMITISFSFTTNLLTAYSYPEGWSDDFQITYGALGSGRDICFFDIGQDGVYFFVVHDSGKENTFLQRISNQGIFTVKDKELMKENPSYIFLDSSNNFHVFYQQSDEIFYLKFDENGNRILAPTSISDFDMWKSFKPLATADSEGNLAIFWLDQNPTSEVRETEVMYKKLDNEGETLTTTRKLSTIFVGNWGKDVWACFDQDKNCACIFWKAENCNFIQFDVNGNILRDKTSIGLRREQYGQVWNYEQFVVSSSRIHVFLSHTEKMTTPKGEFIAMESYINYTQLWLNGTKISQSTVFSGVNGTIFDSLSVAIDTDQKIHLVWDDDRDYGPSTSASIGYSHDFPREVYYLTLNEYGNQLGSATRVTGVDQRNSRNPYLLAKMTNIFLTWSDNCKYEHDGNLNGFDIFLKSTSAINIEQLDAHALEGFPLWAIAIIGIAIGGVILGLGAFFLRKSKRTVHTKTK